MFSSSQVRENLCLSYVSSGGSFLENPTSVQIYEYILESIKRSKLINDKFEIVWGPAVIKVERNTNDGVRIDDHVIYMAKNLNVKDDYRVAIRGTVSDFNKIEDIDVDQVEWTNVDIEAPSGLKVSEGTSIAMKAILEGKSNNTPGLNTTLYDFIYDLESESGNGFDVTITGHSLGGCLASTLALYLKTFFNKIDPLMPQKKNIRIHACTFAAPTAGSKAFADYSEEVFNAEGKSTEIYQSNFLRVYNTTDLVPCAWVVNEFERFRNLYDGVTPVPEDLKGFLDTLISTLSELPDDDKYTQIEPSEGFTYPLNSDEKNWLAQVTYQHISSYPSHYDLVYKSVNMASSDEGDIIVVGS